MPSLANPWFLSLKSGLAVALALLIVRHFGVHDEISAAFVAMACVSPTVVAGLRRGLEQLTASFIGGAIIVLLLSIFPRHPLTLGAATALTVLSVFKLGFQRAYLVAGFTVIYVIILPASMPHLTLEQRLMAVAAGFTSATVVNILISATAHRSIFGRRMRIVRGVMGDSLAKLAACAADPSRRNEAARCVDGAFVLLAEVERDLGDARREGKIRRKVIEEIASFEQEIAALMRLTHHARELGIQVEESGATPELVTALEALRDSFRDGGERELKTEGAWGPHVKKALEAAKRSRAVAAA